jgi:hypothetical protein
MDEKTALLELCQYEVLGELQPSEDGERFVFPEEIDPSEVVGTEDGIIIGGQLLCSDDDSFCFEQDTIQSLGLHVPAKGKFDRTKKMPVSGRGHLRPPWAYSAGSSDQNARIPQGGLQDAAPMFPNSSELMDTCSSSRRQEVSDGGTFTSVFTDDYNQAIDLVGSSGRRWGRCQETWPGPVLRSLGLGRSRRRRSPTRQTLPSADQTAEIARRAAARSWLS